MRFPQVVRDLLAAREALEKRGLAKGVRLDANGRVCAHGALGIAIEGDANGRSSEDTPRECAAGVFLVHAHDVEVGPWTIDGIARWNNLPGTTLADVLGAFDDAASLALSESVRS